MEFLVHITLRAPDGMDPGELEELRAREASRAAELAAERSLLRLWRVPGQWANWGYWRAPDAAELHALLDTLPLRALMTVEVHPLDRHPSDPEPAPSTSGPDHPGRPVARPTDATLRPEVTSAWPVKREA